MSEVPLYRCAPTGDSKLAYPRARTGDSMSEKGDGLSAVAGDCVSAIGARPQDKFQCPPMVGVRRTSMT